MQQFGGISRYFANIHHTLNRRQDTQSELGVLYSKNYYLKEDQTPVNTFFGKYLLRKYSKRFRWNMKYSKYLIQKNNFDLLHPSYYHPYFLKFNKKPFVITVHDMIHERFPEYFAPDDVFVKYKRLCVENANHIIAISEATKTDLKNILQVPDEKITVIHHGYQMNESPDLDPATQSEVYEPDFLLYVGDRRGYKNFPRFLRAIAPLLHQEATLKLICAGGGPFGEAELESIIRLKINNRVSQVSASDQQLISLYRHARAFIFPSLYEGFGLPILEAFKYGCPVIASDQVCFREIGGEATAYFDPADEQDIYRTVQRVINSNELTEELIKKGRRQLLNFPMQLCMDKTISVYNDIISKS